MSEILHDLPKLFVDNSLVNQNKSKRRINQKKLRKAVKESRVLSKG